MHIAYQRLSHLQRTCPAVFRLWCNGLHNDGRDFVVCINRGQQRLSRVKSRKLTIVEYLIQNHTNRVGVSGGVDGVHCILALRRRICAEVFSGMGCVFQRFQFHKA
jgi:hypothetical protein